MPVEPKNNFLRTSRTRLRNIFPTAVDLIIKPNFRLAGSSSQTRFILNCFFGCCRLTSSCLSSSSLKALFNFPVEADDIR